MKGGLENLDEVESFYGLPATIGQTAEVDFQMKTPQGSLRHPVFVRVRGDK